MNKILLTTAVLGMIGGNVFATDLVTGPVEPNTTTPIVSGYNSAALGVNTTVNGTSTIVLGRDNVVNASNTTVIGSNNGMIDADQSTFIGYNNTSMDNNVEQTVIGANSTVGGQGAMVIGTHGNATAIDAVAVGNNTIADIQNSIAIGTNSVTDAAIPTRQMVINGTTHVFAGDSPNSVVSVGSKGRAGAGGVKYYTRQIQNVAAGQVDSSSTDAVNGSQLFAVADEVNTIGGKLNTVEQKVNTNTNAINNLGGVVNGHTQQINRNANNITNNTNRINSIQGDIHNNTNAINQLKSATANHESRITDLENKTYGTFNNVMNEVAKAGAANAALSALHYLGYNSDDKLTFAAGYGHYKNANAVALGAFYAPTEHVMFSLGTTLGAAKMINAGISFRLGKGSEYELNHKGKITELENLVNVLMQEVAELKAGK